MCNGLNYTKLNRRLTDIKSDWEKLVGKRILHTIIINIGTIKRDTTTTTAPPTQLNAMLVLYPVSLCHAYQHWSREGESINHPESPAANSPPG